MTAVSVKRQKLLGLKTKAGKPATDDTLVQDLQLKANQKLTLLGSADVEIEKMQKQAEVAPHVQDDFDIADEGFTEVDVKDQPAVQEKLQRRIASVQVKVLNPPRPGKKCLVLDIDYTLFDLGSAAEKADLLARPFLHEFLAAAYADYDIIIWSATGMKWVEVKMRELGVSTNPNYKITCFLDHMAMVTVFTDKYGLFDCKPLQFIWAKFPDNYTEDNTIMFDDLRRNYILNKQNGLVIRPFKRSHRTRHTDRELLHLSIYLQKIAGLPSLRKLNHKHWERHIPRELAALQQQEQREDEEADRQAGPASGT
ncbi:hypothetical protein N2152v2_006074 [Parachlorella kessleri]